MLLLQIGERTWPAGAVHDTVAAVLRDPAFGRSLQRSIADVLMLWLVEWFGRLQRYVKHLPSARVVVIGVAALIVLGVVTRLVLAARARPDDTHRLVRRRGGTVHDDAWLAAEELMTAGHFEAAAHALYRGVTAGLALNDRLHLDPSKTSGDYARELRWQGSSSFEPFRAFVKRFDVAVYGHGGCDADAVRNLRALSAPLRAKSRAA